MGNANPNQYSNDLFTSFSQVKKDHQGIVLQHKDSHQTYLLKQYTHASDMEFQRHRSRVEKDCEQGCCQFILGVYRVKTHTIQGLCSTVHKLYVIYQYPQVTLMDQIIARSREGKKFDQNQLWSIIQSCNTALGQLKPGVSLNPHLVYVTHNGQLKMIHNDMYDENYRYSLDTKYFYAPEKMFNFNRIDGENSLVKEGVFSMGMTVLQAALLAQTMDFYDFTRFLFLEPQLQEMLRKVEQRYSSDFSEMLAMLLHIDPESRPTYTQIDKILDNFWSNNEQQNQNQPTTSIPQQKGIIKNMITVNSNQKSSIQPQPSLPHSKTNMNINKISQSIQYNQTHHTQHHFQTQKHEKKQIQNKQNLYTDPKLLQMIRKDLEDINKLKQSALKETIKYSFLYPESDSIFKSIQDVKLNDKHKIIESSAQSIHPLQQNDSIQKIPNQFGREEEECPEEQATFGKIHDKDGHEYEGHLLNGNKHGTGRLLFDDGAFYQGQFKNDKINGKGILYYRQNQPAYDGMWLDGQFHGHGTLFNEYPEELPKPFDYKDFDEVQQFWLKYTGQFIEDSKQGNGQLWLTNGQMIEGSFSNDCVNGQCVFYATDGGKIRGRWDQNVLVHIYEQE